LIQRSSSELGEFPSTGPASAEHCAQLLVEAH
jgi:hypothetical protein